jgi:DNA polymerase-3 subunit alpha
MAALEAAIERGASEQRDKRSGQTSLFGLIEAAAPKTAGPPQGETYPTVEAWNHKQLLAFEKEALGFYVSGHPLDRYRGDLMRYANATTADFAEGRRGVGEAAIGGIVAQYREMITKKGDKMARFVLEDQTGGIEVVCFPKTFEKVRHVLVSDEPILCSGEIKNEGTSEQADWKMMMNDASPIADLRQAKTTRVDIHLNADSITTDQVAELRAILADAPRGNCTAVVRLRIPGRSETVIPLPEMWQVAPSDELLTRLERILGERVATFA